MANIPTFREPREVPLNVFFKMFRQFSLLHEKISAVRSQISDLLSPDFMGLVFNEIPLLKYELSGVNNSPPFPSYYDLNNKVSIWKQHIILLCLIQPVMKCQIF